MALVLFLSHKYLHSHATLPELKKKENDKAIVMAARPREHFIVGYLIQVWRGLMSFERLESRWVVLFPGGLAGRYGCWLERLGRVRERERLAVPKPQVYPTRAPCKTPETG